MLFAIDAGGAPAPQVIHDFWREFPGDAEGRVFRWFGTNTDVSAQRSAEARLAMTQEQWRELFEAAADPIFITDAESRYLEVNPAACALLGYEREELLKLVVADVLPEDERPRHARWRVAPDPDVVRGPHPDEFLPAPVVRGSGAQRLFASNRSQGPPSRQRLLSQ